MSSILKALQKLERERETRQGKPANIHKGILREDRRSRRGKSWTLFILLTGTALAAALLTYVLTGKNHIKEPTVSLPALPTAAREISTPTPAPLTPAVNLSVPVIRQTPPPAIEAAPVPPRRPDQQIQPVITPAVSPPPIAPTPQPPVPAASPLPALTVAGIGWREEAASRIAVINGSPVGEGALINGAKVEEIFPDRVRFSFGEKSFDVPVGKSSSPH